MFCGNCGSKAVEGDLFCVTCGQAQHSESALEPGARPVPAEPKTPSEESNPTESVPSAAPVDRTIPVTQSAEKPVYCRHSPSERSLLGAVMQQGSQICLGCRRPYAPGSPSSGIGRDTSDPKIVGPAVTRTNWFLRNKVLVGIGTGLFAVLIVVLAMTSSSSSGMPPADPAQALHRLKDVTNIDLPIDDAGVDVSKPLVPSNLQQQPSPVGEYLGAVSMGSGSTVELRVSAYALDSDAAAYTLWWNTSGAKESIGGSVAVQCGRIVVDGAWVDRHSHDETIKLLHDAYPDCTPYLPEKVSAPGPSAEPTPPMVETPPSSAPTPTSTRTPPPAADGTVPRDAPVGANERVAGAFAITNLVISDKDPTNLTVSFTVKNTTKKVVNLLPQVFVKEDIGNIHMFAMWGGEQGAGLICHTFRPNESERITLGEGSRDNINGYERDRSFPTNWTSAEVSNGPQGC
jgi:hypothetical protein